ncbi:MAG: hypothetical protein HY737_08140 [Candidatus Omnitrophica bacterium]|nr:hypothetical protein [Candidatus Omnitrophota bacterium]
MQILRAQPRRAQQGKMLVPLLSVVAILAIGVAAVAIVLKFDEQNKRLAKERELAAAQSQVADLRRQINDVQQAKAKVDQELSQTRQDLAASDDQLKQAVAKQTELAKSLENRDKEIGRITKDLEQSRNEAKTVSAKLNQLQTERDGLRQRIAELEKAKTDLQASSGEGGEPTVELGKVKVNGEAPVAMSIASASAPVGRTIATPSGVGASASSKPSAGASSASDGQVVVVNREYDFIVMNLGKNQGLIVGQEFQVMRNREVLGRVKVEKVYDELSAAAILPNSKKDSIREGDSVRAL